VATLLADDPAVPLDVRRHGVRRRGAVRIVDITYAVPGGDRVEAYLVTPGGAGPFAGVVFAHLYAPTRADADRTQFLDEAVALAQRGTVSVLPQGTFPYREPPTDAAHDVEAVTRQAVAFRRAVDVVVGVRGVDPARLGYVGHDYGAMYGTLVAAADRRVRALALIAPSPRWATWFVQYWSAGIDDPEAYGAALSPLDPRLLLRETRAAVLLQLGRGDTFVPDEDAEELRGAVPPQSEVRLYDGGHEPGQPARRDRERWLADRLGLPAAR
jgi:dienelactone hydrolase